MRIELRPLSEVRPYEANPRKIDAAAVAAVAQSLREFGFRQPIVIDAAGVIIVGHVRYRAALELGLEQVPVHVAEDLTAEQIQAYRIADNATGDLTDWDYELLPIELEQLKAANYDLGLLGFSAEDLAGILDSVKDGLCDPDEVPLPPDEAITKRGDLIILGDHRLLCGDSSKAEDLDRLLAGQVIHLVNSDPPYNVKVEPRSNNAIAAGLSSFEATHHQSFDAERKSTKPTNAKLRAKDRPLANDFVSEQEFDRLLAAWFGNMARVLVPGGGFYIWGGFSNLANYPQALKAAQLYFSQAIIWIKNQAVLTRKDFMTAHEWAFYGWREGAAHRFFGDHNVPDVWELNRSEGEAHRIGRGVRITAGDGTRIDVLPPDANRKAREIACDESIKLCTLPEASDVWQVKKVPGQQMVHLTEKPVELAVRAMQFSSLPGENVLDLFGGSGSTLIGAEQTGRKAFLMELDPPYCDVIVERWEKFTGRKAQRIPAAAANAKAPADAGAEAVTKAAHASGKARPAKPSVKKSTKAATRSSAGGTSKPRSQLKTT